MQPDPNLIQQALKVKEHSYSPYSKFRVGCAVKGLKSGKIYTGTNVENASYGLTICAERAAICNAVSEGEREFEAIAISADLSFPITPCGACRQFIQEFCPQSGDIPIICIGNDAGDEWKIKRISEFLPFAFQGLE